MLARFALVVMIVGSETDAFNYFVNYQNQASKRQNFMGKNFSSFDYGFWLIRCRLLPFYVFLKTFLCFHSVYKGNFGLKWVNFSVCKFLPYINFERMSMWEFWGQLFQKKIFFVCNKCMSPHS